MAKMTPTVRGDKLVYQQDEHEQMLVLETPAWYAWLESASTFAFTSEEGTFTARKERAGNQRGGWYWKAYRMQQGKLSSRYLGKSETLSLHRLQAAAQALSRSSVSDRKAVRPATLTQRDPLLATKLHVPRPRRQLVSRPALIKRVQEGIQGPLILISAPAGFGKTTLLAQWAAEASRSTARSIAARSTLSFCRQQAKAGRFSSARRPRRVRRQRLLPRSTQTSFTWSRR